MIKRISFFVLLFTVASFLNVNALESMSVRKHENSENRIALTFDDGPHGKYTPEILDILKEYNIKATFLGVGNNCREHPEIV